MSGKPSSTIVFERRWNPSLQLSREAFVDELGKSVSAKPTDMDATLRFNQGRGA